MNMNSVSIIGRTNSRNFKGNLLTKKSPSVVLQPRLTKPNAKTSVSLATLLSSAAASVLAALGFKQIKHKQDIKQVQEDINSALSQHNLVAYLMKRCPQLLDYINADGGIYKSASTEAGKLSSLLTPRYIGLLDSKENIEATHNSIKKLKNLDSQIISRLCGKYNVNFIQFMGIVMRDDPKQIDESYIKSVASKLFNDNLEKQKEQRENLILDRLKTVDMDAFQQRQSEYKMMKTSEKCKLYREVLARLDNHKDKSVADILRRMLLDEQRINIIDVDTILDTYKAVSAPKNSNDLLSVYEQFVKDSGSKTDWFDDSVKRSVLEDVMRNGKAISEEEFVDVIEKRSERMKTLMKELSVNKDSNPIDVFLKIMSSVDSSNKITKKQ